MSLVRRSVVGAAALFLLAASQASFAQASRTWVSGVGDDENPCSRTAPCKTWAGAISKTAAGGEIDALDPGGFGAVTITKSITINGANVGSIVASSVNGIIVNAGATDVVRIRNLHINGLGNGLDGIRVLAAGALHVDNVNIQGYTGWAVNFQPTGSAKLFITNSSFLDNTTVLGGAVRVASAATGTATVVGARMLNNTGAALQVQGATNTAYISGNLMSGNRYGLRPMTGGRIISTLGNQVSDNLVDGAPTGLGQMR